MSLTWRVDELAQARGLGVKELAERAGLDEKTVRNIIARRATRVDVATIAKLSGALEVPPGSLWRTDRRPDWDASLGVAGRMPRAEAEAIMNGHWGVDTDPGLERATRT